MRLMLCYVYIITSSTDHKPLQSLRNLTPFDSSNHAWSRACNTAGAEQALLYITTKTCLPAKFVKSNHPAIKTQDFHRDSLLAPQIIHPRHYPDVRRGDERCAPKHWFAPTRRPISPITVPDSCLQHCFQCSICEYEQGRVPHVRRGRNNTICSSHRPSKSL